MRIRPKQGSLTHSPLAVHCVYDEASGISLGSKSVFAELDDFHDLLLHLEESFVSAKIFFKSYQMKLKILGQNYNK